MFRCCSCTFSEIAQGKWGGRQNWKKHNQRSPQLPSAFSSGHNPGKHSDQTRRSQRRGIRSSTTCLTSRQKLLQRCCRTHGTKPRHDTSSAPPPVPYHLPTTRLAESTHTRDEGCSTGRNAANGAFEGRAGLPGPAFSSPCVQARRGSPPRGSNRTTRVGRSFMQNRTAARRTCDASPTSPGGMPD